MRIKAGKYTLALTMIAAGILMLINTLYGDGIFKDLWIYSPVVLIVFGLEIIALNLIFGHREGYRVEVSAGSIILIIFVIMIFMFGTNYVHVNEPFFDNFISL